MIDEADIRTFNPQKEIAREIILDVLTRHRDAMKQARTGEIPMFDNSRKDLSFNERKLNQVRALNLIIASQREMITISRPIVFWRSMQKWKKSHRSEKEQEENPFVEKEEDVDRMKYDYFKLKYWQNFLRECEQAILTAERTKTTDDDFMITKQNPEGDINELTSNFFDMLEDLEGTYEQIYLLMLTNKIVSSGIEEDEELTYKEKEKEAIRRVVEA